jgi:hypothetical protein
VLGARARYTHDLTPRVLKRLGCRFTPRSDDILARLAELRSRNAPLPQPDRVYTSLREALRDERRHADEQRSAQILWTGTSWVAPEECLVGDQHRRTFLDAVPVLHGAAANTYAALGACPKPLPTHWRRLFEWVDATNPAGHRVSASVAKALHRAYTQLDVPPKDLPRGVRCLLDDRHRVRALDDADHGRFLINDDPTLADAIRTTKVPVWFADISEPSSRSFFHAARVQLLTDAAKHMRTTIGDEARPGETLQASAVVRALHAPAFASALFALATTICGGQDQPNEGKTGEAA